MLELWSLLGIFVGTEGALPIFRASTVSKVGCRAAVQVGCSPACIGELVVTGFWLSPVVLYVCAVICRIPDVQYDVRSHYIHCTEA